MNPDTTILQDNTLMGLSMASWYYSQKGWHGVVLMLYYMASCTLLEEPSETSGFETGQSSGARRKTFVIKAQQLAKRLTCPKGLFS